MTDDWALADYLKDGTLTDSYMKSAQYICGNEFVNLATSNLLNILAAPQNVADAKEFVDAMSWLSHPTGDEFYQQYRDPDAEADFHLSQLLRSAKKLGISVDWDPITEKVILGVASPIVIDLDGDGIHTTSFAEGGVKFDIDGDGHKDRTAWISRGDAFQCRRPVCRDGRRLFSLRPRRSRDTPTDGAGSASRRCPRARPRQLGCVGRWRRACRRVGDRARFDESPGRACVHHAFAHVDPLPPDRRSTR